MSQSVPTRAHGKLTKTVRRHRVIQLKASGKRIQDIATELGVSEKTVDRDLKSQDVHAFLDELVTQQIIDINQGDLSTRLNYRSDLLDKLLPKRMGDKVEVNVNANATSNSESTIPILTDYDALIAEEMAKETSNIRKDNPQEQIHQTQTSNST